MHSPFIAVTVTERLEPVVEQVVLGGPSFNHIWAVIVVHTATVRSRRCYIYVRASYAAEIRAWVNENPSFNSPQRSIDGGMPFMLCFIWKEKRRI